MVTAGSLGPAAHIGLLEIGMALTALGIFILVILRNLTKAPLTPVNHPFWMRAFIMKFNQTSR